MFSEVTLTVLLLLFFCQGLDVSLFREQGERLNTKQRPRLGLIQNYTLELCNTSPAILDSAVVFTAKLRDYSGRLLESDQYEYQWQDMDRTKISHGKFVSSVTRVYRGDCHKQGNYSMTVTVLKDGDRVATSIMLFSLTGELNGNITVKQNLTYHRQEDVLSTDRPIKLKAEIHDKFPSSAQNLAYHWFLNGTRIGISDQPEFSLSLSNPSVQNVTVKVVAKVNTDVFLLPRYVNKSGQFSHSVTLQDPLSRITIKGKDAVAINTRLFINITCHGSGPTSLCWQIFPLGGPPPNVTCSPTVFQANCQHMVNLSIPTAGKYRFVARLDNDVSRTEKQWYMYAYDPGSTNVPAITVPVVFAVLAMAIIVSAAAYIMRLRKKPFVEVADFDFHPSLTRETEGSSLSVRIRRTVQSLVSPRDTGVPRPMRSTFKDYGSVEEDGSL